MVKADEKSFLQYLHILEQKNIPYVWGGANEERPEMGLDCSGFIYVAARKSGALACHRTTALEMQKRNGGWVGIDLGSDSGGLRRASEGDIIWWTWKGKPRIHGHIGILTRDRSGSPAVIHASQSRGRVLVEEVKGRLLDDISWLRRPQIWGAK